jgi:hypothetical protein
LTSNDFPLHTGSTCFTRCLITKQREVLTNVFLRIRDKSVLESRIRRTLRAH